MTAPRAAAAADFPPIHPEALPMPPTTAPTRPQMPARTNGARHSVVAPIPFPDPSELARQRAERAHAEQLREAMRLANAERHAAALHAAAEAGRAQGYKAGYVDGWHWGLTCGGVAGIACGALAVLLIDWLQTFAQALP